MVSVGEGHQEGVAEMMYDELTTASIPVSHEPLGGGAGRRAGSEVEPKKDGVRKSFLLDSFLFLSVLLLQLICNK